MGDIAPTVRDLTHCAVSDGEKPFKYGRHVLCLLVLGNYRGVECGAINGILTRHSLNVLITTRDCARYAMHLNRWSARDAARFICTSVGRMPATSRAKRGLLWDSPSRPFAPLAGSSAKLSLEVSCIWTARFCPCIARKLNGCCATRQTARPRTIRWLESWDGRKAAQSKSLSKRRPSIWRSGSDTSSKKPSAGPCNMFSRMRTSWHTFGGPVTESTDGEQPR